MGGEGQTETDSEKERERRYGSGIEVNKSTRLTKRLSLFVPHVTALILPPASTRQTGRGLQNKNDYIRLHEPASCNSGSGTLCNTGC